jgi:hypothetical protein
MRNPIPTPFCLLTPSIPQEAESILTKADFGYKTSKGSDEEGFDLPREVPPVFATLSCSCPGHSRKKRGRAIISLQSM